MTPSPQQLAICDHVAHSARNLIVEASPGSGKTTTIGMAARRIAPDGHMRLALAFAKMNAEDFSRKLPFHILSSTFHSACRGPVCDALGAKVVPDKMKYILKDEFPAVGWQNHGAILKLVSLLKQQVGEVDIEDLALTYGVDISDSCILPTAEAALDVSDEDRTRVDFDDMLRFALDARVRFPALALVFLDEAQDTNSVQRAILRKMNTRVVAVGDPFQSIFGFRGADSDAMTTLREELDADVLPLSVSYRCSVAVCDEARRVLEDRRFVA